MKKTILTTSIFLCLLFLTENSFSQWTGPTNLSNTTSTTFFTTNAARGIVASGNELYVVWHDNSQQWGDNDVYFRRSTNNGTSWTATNILVNNNSADCNNPSIATGNGALHVVWEDYRNGNAEIYYMRSTNNGVNWGSNVRLTNASGTSDFPAIIVSATGIHIVWRDNRDGNTEAYYKRSTNDGLTWGADVRLTNNSSSIGYPSIFSSGNMVNITFPDNRDGNNEIYYKYSGNGGTNWSSDIRLTNNSADSWESCITGYGAKTYIAFADKRNGGRYHIFLKKSTDYGVTWNSETQVTSQYSHNLLPSIVVNNGGNNIHIGYTNTLNNDGFYDAFYIRSTNGGTNWGAETRISQLFWASYAHIAVTGTTVHLVHRFREDGYWSTHRIHYWRNLTANPTGINTVGSELPENFRLSQNYPNPFNPTTNINFSIPKSGHVKLVVYDMAGKIVAELVNGNYSAGTYKVDFDASKLSSGTYFYRIEAGEFTSVKKMTLVK